MKNNYLKTLFITFFSVVISNSISAQSQNWWKTDGNGNGNNNTFIGTTNNAALRFRANNTEWFSISPSGQYTFNGLSGAGNGLMLISNTGNVYRLNFSGNANEVLTAAGTWQSINSLVPSAGYWTMTNAGLYTNNNTVINGTLTATGLNILHKIQADTIKGTVRVNVNGNMVLGEDGTYNGIYTRLEDLRINSKPGQNFNTVLNAGTNGNVGIGVNNPTHKLEVFGNSKLNGELNLQGINDLNINNTYELILRDSVSGNISKSSFRNFLQALNISAIACLTDGGGGIIPIWQYGVDKAFIGNPCTANVGINTNNPLQALDVRGNAIVSNKFVVGTTVVPANIKAHIKSTNEIGFCVETDYNGDYNYAFKTVINRDFTKAMAVIDSRNGEETFRLYGNGNLYATRVFVRNTPFPDYVFNKDYNLMSLSELEKYINDNKKLPKMPSADEVEKNGVDIGEINRLLVEKIEELTLYLLEQDKKIKALQEEINKLK